MGVALFCGLAVADPYDCGPFFLELDGVRADGSQALTPAQLDLFFGPAFPPKIVKPWERRPDGGVVVNPTTQTLDPRKTDQRLTGLDPAKVYSFLVDVEGRLVVGEELVVGKPSETLGHPTLVDGGLGRMSGDLYFQGGAWRINQKSLRYSMNNPGRKRPQLEMTARLFERFGLKVEVNFLEHLDIF